MRSVLAFLACVLLTMGCAADAAAATPTISQVFAFYCNSSFSSCPYGIEPTMAPIQLSNGNLYGVTWWAGTDNPNAGGTVWSLTTAGAVSVVHTFQPNKEGKFPAGKNPVIGFAQGADHNLYGITESGGATNEGVMYKLLPAGKFQMLRSFCTGACTDIQGPIILGADGNFYGVVEGGGAIFKLTPQGAYSLVYALNPTTDGRASSIMQGKDGNFYGTGVIGSACEQRGTVFKLTPAGAFSFLATFGQLDLVRDTLIQASDGNFYGAVASSIFRLTPSGTETIIYNLQDEDGYSVVEVMQASDGNLWVLTSDGGPQPARPGEVFAITLAGSRVTGAAFTCATTGCSPTGMIQGSDGNFYGIAGQGGAVASGNYAEGTVFKIDAGLAP